MSTFQTLNPLGKLISLSLCVSAITIGMGCLISFFIGMIAAVCTAVSGTAAIFNHFNDWPQWRPICQAASTFRDPEARVWLDWGCGLGTMTLSIAWPKLTISVFYVWPPVFGYGAITVLCFFVTAVMMFVGTALTRIGVSIADPSYYEVRDMFRRRY